MLNNNLYSDIPPTKLRNRDEVFIEASNKAFWVWLADRFFYRMIEKRFFSLRIKDEQNFEKRDKRYSSILYAPHTCWWDGTVGYNLCRRVFHTVPRMMIEELNRFPILARAGAFPINKKSPQAAMRSLQYAVKELKDPNRSLWIFPQGIIRPPNYRPIQFQSGIAYIAKNCAKAYGAVNLIPIAVNYTFLREDKPEVIVDVGRPILMDNPKVDRKILTEQMENSFAEFCNRQMAQVFAGELDDHRMLFQTKLPWYKKWERKLKKIDINAPSA